MTDTKNTGRPDEAQITAWKKEHGELHKVKMDDLFTILRKPRLHDLEIAMAASKKPNAKELDFNRMIVKRTTLYVDPAFMENDERELYLYTKVGEIAAIREGEVEKL